MASRERMSLEVPPHCVVRDARTGELTLHPEVEARCRFLFGPRYHWQIKPYADDGPEGAAGGMSIEISCPRTSALALQSLFNPLKST
jgi:hypothetical protein